MIEATMIRFFTYSQYHNKKPVVGSTFIRVQQLLKYWPDAGLYTYGENPDALIFQKVYITADYKFPAHFENTKILDICDPDWIQGVAIKETIDAMDAITVPTEALQQFIQQMTDKLVVIIPDRFDLEAIPKKPKLHTKPAKIVTWFGYHHNAELLRPALPLIKELGLKLRIIANEDPFPHQYPGSIPLEDYTFIKYHEDTFYDELRKADFAILPGGFRPEDRFKSNNKTVKANLAGLPVATDKEEVLKFIDPAERHKWIQENYDTIRSDYDVRKSVEQFKDLIERLQGNSKEI
jgi:hypothetical protein